MKVQLCAFDRRQNKIQQHADEQNEEGLPTILIVGRESSYRDGITR